MTPFEKAGYTKGTTFRALIEYEEVKVGDILTIFHDDNTSKPTFESENGDLCVMYLPEHGDDLEVYNDTGGINYLKLNTDLNDLVESHGISLVQLALILSTDNLNQ